MRLGIFMQGAGACRRALEQLLKKGLERARLED